MILELLSVESKKKVFYMLYTSTALQVLEFLGKTVQAIGLSWSSCSGNKELKSWMWWHTPVTLALRRMRQEIPSSLRDYIVQG